MILKGIAKTSGDGWKAKHRKGDVVFVYARQLGKPYGPGQFPRVGNPIWTASVHDFTFTPASLLEKLRLLKLVFEDWTNPHTRRQLVWRWLPR